jgi:hypothetical protein
MIVNIVKGFQEMKRIEEYPENVFKELYTRLMWKCHVLNGRLRLTI